MKKVINAFIVALSVSTIMLTTGCAGNKEADLGSIMKKVTSEISTIQEVRIYNEDTDPNNAIGKPGMYVQAAAFWDTRTEHSEEYAEEKGMWGTNAGGSIEIYSNSKDAKNRIQNFEAFGGTPLTNPGAYERVDNVVIRASRFLKKSDQDEILSVLRGALKES